MSITHSTKIPTANLVFYYDMFNKKSFAGANVRNLLHKDDGTKDWTSSNVGGGASIAQVNNERYVITCNTAGAWRLLANLSNLQNNMPYTMSLKYRFLHNTNTLPAFRMTDWCDESLSNVVIIDEGNNFYAAASGSRATYNSTYRFMDFFMSANTVVEVWDLMLEQRSFAAPYAYITRSNVDILKDLTGKNPLIYESNVSYSAPNEFNFWGGSGYFAIPKNPNISLANAITIVQWLETGPDSNVVRRNPYNQAYGGAGTITHETNGAFSYYWGASGVNGNPYVSRGSSFSVQPNEKAMIAVTRSVELNLVKWYKNGSLVTNVSAYGWANIVDGSNAIFIGTGYTSGFQGKIYSTMIYDRFLSDEEITQIYNRFKHRYGL